MIDHLELRTNRLPDCLRFYNDVLAPLGYVQQLDGDAKGFGVGPAMDFFLIAGEPSDHVHFAFAAATRAEVDDVWRAGEVGGHALDRAPALMPHIHPDYYAGFLRDPDGRLVEVVCHTAQ